MSGRVCRVVEVAPVVDDEVVKQSLPDAILEQLLDKVFNVPQRDILGAQIAFAVKQALKQVAHDYDLEYQVLKDKYLTEGVEIAPSPPKAVKPKSKPKAKASESKAEAPAQIQAAGTKPALSKMKKDDLVKECEEFGISTEGTVPQLRERLKGARAGTLAPAPEVAPPPAPKKAVKKKAKKADKKEKPVHTHTLQEEPVDGCGVCETYGNIAGGKDDEDDFEESEEAGLSIKERLKRLLATHGAAEEEPNDEDDPEYNPDMEDGEL